MTIQKAPKIRVLIVDDSASVRMVLERIFSDDPGFEVAGLACDGEEAIEAVKRLSPDVVTMDICMPLMNGLDATRRIMETHPTPIVILSGNLDPDEVVSSFKAMEAGALIALPKPQWSAPSGHESDVASLVRTVRLMSEIKVVKRWPRYKRPPLPDLPVVVGQAPAAPRVVAIGASTGGPPVINTILSGLPPEFPLPVLIVQHMSPGFIRGFAEWLGLSSRLPVHVASHGERLLPGHVYVAPEGVQMEVTADGRVTLNRNASVNGQCPSVSALFRSVADEYGRNAVGILLTGMGDDGVRELGLMKSKGAVTIAQDRKSCVVFGMPGEAVRLDAAMYVLPPDRIVAALVQLEKCG